MVSNGLMILVKKEIKETIRNPRFIVFTVLLPLILYPIMGYMFVGATSIAKEKFQRGVVGVIDEDNSFFSNSLLDYLNRSGVRVVRLSRCELNNLGNLSSNYLGIILIPRGFGENISKSLPASIHIYSIINGINIMEQNVYQGILSIVNSYKDYLRAYLASKYGMNPMQIINPVVEDVHIYVRGWGREYNIVQLQMISWQIFFWPWITFSLIISVVQLSATFLSEEKEQKTLEILLTLPVRRTTILFSKVIGSGILALLSTISYIIGFLIYVDMIMRGLSGVGITLSISYNPISLVLMGLIFFLCILFSAALGLTVSILAQDTKSAQSLASAITFPVMMLAFLVMFIDISSLPKWLQLILYGFPYTYLMEGIKYIFLAKYSIFIYGIIDNLVAAIVMLLLVSKIFTTEKIITMRVRFGRKRVRTS